MAKGSSKVSDDESDEELDPDEFANLINEYTCVIKREKGKVKRLEEARAKLEVSNSELLAKYNELLKKHEVAKQFEERYDALKLEHIKLRNEHEALELTFEAIDPSKVEKVNVSTSCDDLLMDAFTTNALPEMTSSREKELMEQVASLKTGMTKLTHGEFKHKEMLFYNARDYGRRGLGSFPVLRRTTSPPSTGKINFVKEVGSYCKWCMVVGHHTKDCPISRTPYPTLPKDSTTYDNTHYLLSNVKGKVVARFIGKLTKEQRRELPKRLWVPKALVTLTRAPKEVWVPKANL
jgi:hypothetical protein